MTQKEIAEMLNISPATVCLALADSPKIKLSTREAVQKLARSMNYRPNLAGRMLQKNRSFSVGVVFPSISHSFFGELQEEIHRKIMDRDYLAFFFSALNDQEKKKAVESMIDRNVDGVIAFNGDFELLQPLVDNDIPLMLYGGNNAPVKTAKIKHVQLDRFEAGYCMTNHLLKNGYHKIAYGGALNFGEARCLGYKSALMQAGLNVNENLATGLETDPDSSYKGMLELLKRERPDAVIAHNDTTAIGIIRAIIDVGLKVPDDIAVAGFDNINIAKYLPVSLTTMGHNKQETAQYLVDGLFDMIDGDGTATPDLIMLKYKLIVRESCGTKK